MQRIVTNDPCCRHRELFQRRERSFSPEFLYETEDRIEDDDDENRERIDPFLQQARYKRGTDQNLDDQTGELSQEDFERRRRRDLRQFIWPNRLETMLSFTFSQSVIEVRA